MKTDKPVNKQRALLLIGFNSMNHYRRLRGSFLNSYLRRIAMKKQPLILAFGMSRFLRREGLFRNIYTSTIAKTLALAFCLSAIGYQSYAQQPIAPPSHTERAIRHFDEPQLWRSQEFSGLLRRTGSRLMPVSRYANAKASPINITATTMTDSPPAVLGNGTVGRISRWVRTAPSGNSILGDSIITEASGRIGIGTATPTSTLTVQGMIETTLGGYKFPDGTIQTTAAVSGLQSVVHDASLTGIGTAASPLGIAPGGVSTMHLANASVTATKIANGTVVRSLNGMFDNVSIMAGSNITVTPGANTLTIAATGLLGSVAHDTTLQGNGTTGSPLGITVPLILSGSVDDVIQATSAAEFGHAIIARGGNRGIGVVSFGGNGDSSSVGGSGVFGRGGNNSSGFGGSGVRGIGGISGNIGGEGVEAEGGDSNGTAGGGVYAAGGNSSGGFGGRGVTAFGGTGRGTGNSGGVGIFAGGGAGVAGATTGRAGSFQGDVEITGTLSKGGGSFKIDHPLDPENKYLYHSFVESPDMMNIYNGNVVTDENGEATVTLSDWFEALNREFRYQLTVIGTFAQAIVAEKVKGNRFKIKTNAPGVEVSWQVTGIRQDAWANKNRIPVEEVKSEREHGYYLHPEVFNQAEERSIEWARNPELMQRLKQQRLESKQKSGNQ